jgi:hypothetical protein
MNQWEHETLENLLAKLLDVQDHISWAKRQVVKRQEDNIVPELVATRNSIKDEIFSFVESLTEK